jgi:AcrR family transcriptional regulator
MDAAEHLMRAEGYAAVTSRRVGDKAGVPAQLVHYYFRTMDELFIALWRRYTDKNIVRQSEAFAADQPLRKIWEYSTDVGDTTLALEFAALARHRKVIRAELAHTGEQFRNMQAAAISQFIEKYGLVKAVESAEILAIIISGVSRVLINEQEIGITGGHAQLRAYVERWLQKLEGAKG